MTTRMLAVGFAVFVAMAQAGLFAEEKPWSLSVEVRESYDDNRDGTAANKEAIFGTSIQPRADIRASGDKADVILFYSPSLCFLDNPRDDQEGTAIYHSVGLDAVCRASPRLQLNVGQFFYSTEDPALMVESRTFDEYTRYILSRSSLGGSYEVLQGRAIVSLRGSYLVKRYDSDEYSLIGDKDQSGIEMWTAYRTRSRVSLLSGVSYVDTEMGTEYEGVNRGLQVLFVGGGVEKTFSMWSVRARGGLEQAFFDNASIDYLSRPAGDLQFIYAPTDATMMDLLLQHRITKGDISPYSSQERTSVILTASHSLRRNLDVGVTGLYGKGDYEFETVALNHAGTSVIPEMPDGSDTLASITLSATCRIRRHMTLGVHYRFEDWSADEYMRTSHQRNVFGVAVKAEL